MAMLVLGIPATMAIADLARRVLWRAIAAGGVPAIAATLFLTDSRGGAIALAVGLAV
ncbi:MAG: hypothetical protein LC713_02055 [Actinobacteria bacterium]|nr:hypothetical protein [Actinomycetota bacterium]